ncbi:MAG: TonB-dependent receptor [Pirellulales bacterium]|nr:TonB-dependent receptor [Pirellulales bacterium]
MFATSDGVRKTRVSAWLAIPLAILIVLPASWCAAQTGTAGAVAPAPMPGDAPAAQGDILDMDIDQLARVDVKVPSMEVEVTSVSRTAQPIGRSAAAVYVLTNEMIKRSGARSVPEALRLVPGVSVVRINASAWAISIRGFNARFANKLLVQIDGVAIYSPTHSGVFWEREYVMLEDVDRIEVIRGPGATVWGANAVNGIINIVTKQAKDTHGIHVDGGGGTEHRQFTNARVGGQSGNLHWRMYGMNLEDGKGHLAGPARAADDPRLNQGGFRADWTPTRRDTFTIQGDFYSGEDNQTGVHTPPDPPVAPMDFKTSRILTRWSRQVDEDTDWAVQLYYYNPYALGANLNNVATFDFDYQYHMIRGRHDIVWGLGYRNSDERWVMGPGIITVHDGEQIPSYFVQDTITLVEDRWFATFGSKFDHNSVTDFEYQPTARLTYTPSERTSFWGAISRAVRTPSLMERVFILPKSENALSYELGVRQQPTDRFFWEFTTFFSRYDSLLGTPSFFYYYNVGKADTYGFECNATYQATKHWHLSGSYTFFVQDVDYAAGYFPTYFAGGTPRNMWSAQSGWDLGANVTFDAILRYVDALAIGVPSYLAGDVRLAWQPRKNLELAVVGQNLLAGAHYEFADDYVSIPTEVEPGVYGMVSWRY